MINQMFSNLEFSFVFAKNIIMPSGCVKTTLGPVFTGWNCFCSVTWCKWIDWFLMQNLWKLKNSCFFGTDSELKNMIWWHHSISTNNAPAWIAHCISTWIFYRALQKYETFDLWLAFCLLATWIQYYKHIVHSSK